MGELAELAGCGGAESLEVAIIVLLSDVEKGTGKIVILQSLKGDGLRAKSGRIYRIFVGGRLTCIESIYMYLL